MAKFFGMSVAVIVLIIGAITAYAFITDNDFRYKITVTVETPEGVKTGSSVREVSVGLPLIDLPEGTANVDITGEAIVVDLGERGVLYGLIRAESDRDVYKAFPIDSPPLTSEGLKYYTSLPVGKSAELPRENWPTFVTFTDPDDPKSVTLVRGYKFNPETQKHVPVRRVEEIFGDGVTIKDITITITDAPVTERVDEYLPKTFQSEVIDKWRELPKEERRYLYDLTRFKQGDFK